MRYAHQGGMNPPVIVVHGNALDRHPAVLYRYLERCFMEAFKLQGTPLAHPVPHPAHNPFAHRGLSESPVHTSDWLHTVDVAVQQITL
jgi:GTP-binding protein